MTLRQCRFVKLFVCLFVVFRFEIVSNIVSIVAKWEGMF
jgi:hypothetical protein